MLAKIGLSLFRTWNSITGRKYVCMGDCGLFTKFMGSFTKELQNRTSTSEIISIFVSFTYIFGFLVIFRAFLGIFETFGWFHCIPHVIYCRNRHKLLACSIFWTNFMLIYIFAWPKYYRFYWFWHALAVFRAANPENRADFNFFKSYLLS